MDIDHLERAWQKATAALLAERNAAGYWEGELSSSALSTATACFALHLFSKIAAETQAVTSPLVARGLKWLAEHQNPDGGWGDTIASISNISTSALCWACFGGAGAHEQYHDVIRRAESFLGEASAKLTPDGLARSIIARYGKDRTFSVPILTMCALAGRLGNGRAAWEQVIPLPFELAACSPKLFAALRLPVVSYALPALIAIGQARHVNAPSRNPLVRWLRNATRAKTLRVLEKIQPSSGGFLEATPLTSFVLMSLAGSGQASFPAARHCAEFLIRSARADGSWPIDTNLATWVTTLSVNALGPEIRRMPAGERDLISRWLRAQQYRVVHPYTNAAPGGWAWTDLPGGVPDADDTAGALVALAWLDGRSLSPELQKATESGLNWLLSLQNSDGGVPTFCRGWTNLPFDRSSPDLTAHALRAWSKWAKAVSPVLRERLAQRGAVAVDYLLETQTPDGGWVPLWFGNQFDPHDENHVYGTAKVLIGLSSAPTLSVRAGRAISSGTERLLELQHAEGAWGAHKAVSRGGNEPLEGTIEETALAIEALATLLRNRASAKVIPRDRAETGLRKGLEWLLVKMESDEWRRPAPIGFYFAKLWYLERLYPIAFSVGALRAARDYFRDAPDDAATGASAE